MAISSLILAAFVCFEIRHLVGQPFDLSMPRYVICRRDLFPGYRVSLRDFSFIPSKQVPGKIPLDALTDQDLELLRGATLRTRMNSKAVLTLGDLHIDNPNSRFSPSIPKGYRAYLVGGLQIPSVLSPGDQVDVVFTPANGDGGSRTIFEGIKVLKSRTVGEETAVLLALPPTFVPVLEHVKNRGKVSLTLRSRSDFLAEPVAERVGRSRARKVEILQEGQAN